MEVICLDTDILISHRRAKEKDKTRLFELSKKHKFAVTVITTFELLRGDNSDEDKFWKNFFSQVEILEMDYECSEIAAKIFKSLKEKGNMIGIEDILIASIAVRNGLKVATNNTSHFLRIENLKVV